MPTEVGGSETTRFADMFYTNTTSKGLRTRATGGAAGGFANYGMLAGESCAKIFSSVTSVDSSSSAPLCYFEEDPIIPESEKIEI